MNHRHLAIRAQLKTMLYLLLSVSIIAYLLYQLQSPSEPPRLPSVGKSQISQELNIEGYTPPIGTEVEVLCHIDYNTLVRTPQDRQFVTPPGSLDPRLPGLEDLNESYTYNISKEKLERYFDCALDSLLPLTGDYVTGIANIYEFPHLVAVGDGERYHGVRIVTNEFRYIQDIQYYEDGHSRNLFGKLPFYEDIACKNLCASVGITGSNSLWDRALMVAVNFLFLTLIVFLFTRAAQIIILRWGIRHTLVKWTTRILHWALLLPLLYIYMMAILDFYHGLWVLVFLYLLSLIIGFYQISFENSAKSIYMCPSCKKYGVYHPQKVVISRKVIGKVPYSWPDRPLWVEGVEIPDKTYYRQTTYILKGACSACHYEDQTHYTEDDQYPSRTDCPLCGSKMHFSEEDGIYREWCPSCRHFLLIDRNKEGQPAPSSHRRSRSRHVPEEMPKNNNSTQEDSGIDTSKRFRLQDLDSRIEEAKRKKQEAQATIDKLKSDIRTSREIISDYQTRIGLFGDSDGTYQRVIREHEEKIDQAELEKQNRQAEKEKHEKDLEEYQNRRNSLF